METLLANPKLITLVCIIAGIGMIVVGMRYIFAKKMDLDVAAKDSGVKGIGVFWIALGLSAAVILPLFQGGVGWLTGGN